MTEPFTGLIDEERRSNWIRLRTLIVLRWIAIAGQITTILVGAFLFGLRLDYGAFAVVIGASVVVNMVSAFVFPENTRLSERAAVGMLLFDTVQLAAMLYLSGGLHNPFSLLVLVPTTISATALRPQSTVVIGAASIVLVSFIANWHEPLRNEFGFIMRMPDIFVFGSWAAIVIGVVFLGVFAWKVTSEMHSMSEALLATQMALAREQKLTDLGGVVAAAAHELGTPLATIKLVSSELSEELADNEALREDAVLINEQADRCRDILRSMGRAGKDDLHMRTAPIDAVLTEAAEPHIGRGKEVVIESGAIDGGESPQPAIYRRPEIIHGLRNLVQNAVDFAETTVWVDASWDADTVRVRIIDDGSGFPAAVLGRIGDPFVRRRRVEFDRSQRPGYEGMGLGLFIAKTLLERTGAEISFANGSDRHDQLLHAGRRSGAIVELVWPRSVLCPPEDVGPLGQNIPFLD